MAAAVELPVLWDVMLWSMADRNLSPILHKIQQNSISATRKGLDRNQIIKYSRLSRSNYNDLISYR